MGLIQAALSSAGGVLSDQWKEYYLEALWTQDNVCLPRGKKFTYVLFVCERL